MDANDIVCSIGRDGKKRFFKNGKRIKNPSEFSSRCSKKTKTPKKNTIRRSENKISKPSVKKTKTTKKGEEIKSKTLRGSKKPSSKRTLKDNIFHIWEVKSGYTSVLPDGSIEKYWSGIPDGKTGKTFELPVRHVSHISKYDLETKILEDASENPEKYAVYDQKDNFKLISYPHSFDSRILTDFDKILPLKNHLKYIWEFRNFKRSGGESYTFTRPVYAFFKMRKEIKEIVRKRHPNSDLFVADSETNQAMKEIVDMRQNWNEEQWKIFENNFYVKFAIFSKLKKL